MTTPLLPAVEIETGPQPSWAVIWLHGLGADGHDFASIVPDLELPASPGVRFVFPHAPVIPVTCNQGYEMPAWYDILHFDRLERHADEAGVRASREAIRALIEREKQRGIAADHIVIAGFSQGGAMAYTAGLTHPERLGGIIALSTYLPLPDMVAAEATAANQHTPIFAAHGTQDPVVPYPLGDLARQAIANRGNPLEWHSYPIPHAVYDPETAAIGAWLRRLMA
ncbi:alpha/beta hydrolase [Chitinimonas lacunae]|uniref:Alpha/beta hydrolase n=1 Tax=Chitinimonas lacunae TaxID=1963018 RepID=A0ABV8MPN9_9NEIS